MESLTTAQAVRALGYLAALGLAAFFYRLYQVRMMFRRVKSQHGVDILPHSFLLGHLPIITKLAIKLKMPANAHGQLLPLLLAREYPEIGDKGLLYVDVWPLGPPMLAVYHPDIMSQFTQEASQLKHPNVREEFAPFTRNQDLATMEGPEWKAARAMFNPGFSVKNLMSLMPSFVEEALVFRRRLAEAAASEETVQLEKLTTHLTVDIIGRATLGARLHAQTQPCAVMDAMLSQVTILYFGLEPLKRFNPAKYFWHWLYNRRFRAEVAPHVRAAARDFDRLEGPKTIISLALQSVVNHVKMFLFAGHDTTATTVAYCYYLLSRNPAKLAKLRAEHDAVLGRREDDDDDDNIDADAARIAADPNLLNRMPYTLAVVRETLRIYPVVGTVRIGGPGYFLTVPETGERCPAEGFMLFGTSKSAHLNPRFWDEPEAFIPERWTRAQQQQQQQQTSEAGGSEKEDGEGGEEEEGEMLNIRPPPRNGFRPWELGPRNCVGQELASLELRLILALTVRDFDVRPAYAADAPSFLGDPAYQVQPPDMVTAHPSQGLPARIVRRV